MRLVWVVKRKGSSGLPTLAMRCLGLGRRGFKRAALHYLLTHLIRLGYPRGGFARLLAQEHAQVGTVPPAHGAD